MINDRDSLLAYLAQGNTVQYLHFWGHQPNRDGSIGKSCFSQWFPAPFELEGIQYATAEHYMMAEKARLFDDEATRINILAARTPADAKKLGRKIQGFDDAAWLAHRFEIVVRGNLAKFRSHIPMQQYLLQTGNRVLVEASPVDAIWGIGLAEDHVDANQPAKWPGLNLLGFALMVVRDQLR